MRKGELDRQKFKELIETNKFSMRNISLKAGMAESYCKDLASGKITSPTIEKFIKVCDILGVYPNDLIPLEWKSPANELNENLLYEVLKGVMRIYIERKEPAGLDLEWFYAAVIAAYKKYSNNEENKQPINDNIIYSWLDGKLDSKRIKGQ